MTYTCREWSPHIVEAAEAMYSRLRIADPERYRKWKKLDIDSIDHYCFAAKLAVDAFHYSAVREIEVSE